MRALVGTHTAVLDARLFRAPPLSCIDYQAAIKDTIYSSQNLPITLHPFLQSLDMAFCDQYEQVKTSNGTRGLSQHFKLAQLSMDCCKENATVPGLQEVAFKSWDKVSCYGRGMPSHELDGCKKVFRVKGADGGAVTVEDFVKCFIRSLKDACTECICELELQRFRFWTRCRFSRDKSIVRFEDPYWEDM